MPILRNIRHERFAQAIANGINRTKAYKLAGYTGDRSNAWHLYNGNNATSHNIRKRVVDLMKKDLSKLSPQDILDHVYSTFELAYESGQATAALKACEMLGKEQGLWRDRKENVNINLGSLSWQDTEAFIRERYGDNAETFLTLVKQYYSGVGNNANTVQNPQAVLVGKNTYNTDSSLDDDDNESQ